MDTYALAVTQSKKMLGNLLRWLDQAVAHAEAKGFDPEVYLACRLRPDMFPLLRQIQSACDSAKFLAARLADVPPPVHPDTETTLPELRARIESVVGFLDTLAPARFEGADARRITLGFLPAGSWMRGEDYAIEFGVPNFLFHVTTAYAILRYNGVDLGKRDFIGSMPIQSD